MFQLKKKRAPNAEPKVQLARFQSSKTKKEGKWKRTKFQNKR